MVILLLAAENVQDVIIQPDNGLDQGGSFRPSPLAALVLAAMTAASRRAVSARGVGATE
jgi:hypothetical protein